MIIFSALLLGCIDSRLVALADCDVIAEPEVGQWTESYAADTTTECDRETNPYAWAIYDGRADTAAANLASLSFRKTSDDPESETGPSVDLTWWILKGEADWRDCEDVQDDEVVANGSWDAGVSELFVSGVPLWATDADWEAAPHGAEVQLYLATDGRDEPGVRRWWQRFGLSFTKNCPESNVGG